jgi:dihydroorotase
LTLIIRGGRVIDPANGIDRKLNIVIKDGKVSDLTDRERGKDGEMIDARGYIVVPGLIDIHTHLREPGYEYKESIKTGSLAAAAGGFTSIACMPNTYPTNDNASVTRYILTKASTEGLVNIYPIGAITKGLKGENLSEIGELKEAGCVALSDDGSSVMNSEVLRRGMEYAKGFNMPIISHCEDLNLSKDGQVNEGFISTELGLKGIPNCAEEIMVARDIALSELTGCKLHLAHISSAGSVRIIREAKKRGINITAEVTPHHFTLTEEAVYYYNTNVKVNPPLRTKEDIEAIKVGLREGVIDVIATDHAPHDIDSKNLEFNKAANGIIGLETALPLTLKLVEEGILSLNEAVSKLTINPAKIIDIKKGSLGIGMDADITIIDPDREYTIDREKFKSKSKNTPFHGWKVKGKVIYTIINGRIIYKDNI